ncbi:MAG: hypothetical protein ACYC8T_36705 [Myxococcaceae bacterium]
MTPGPGPGDIQQLLQRDCAIIRWFIEVREGHQFKASPLRDYLEVCERADLKQPSKKIEDIPEETARYYLHLSAAFTRLAWAIRALYGNESVERVDGSFITDELLGEDNKQPGVEHKLPGGIGTLVFAGRLMQAGGGRVCINGKRVPGHDIRWTTADGDLVLVERKDRSYEAGLKDTAETRALRVIDEVERAHIPIEPGAARLLVVAFQHFVRRIETADTDRAYEIALGNAFRRAALTAPPHIVVVEHLGMDVRTHGEKSNFFSPIAVKWEPWLANRILPSVARAIGATK